MIEGLRAELPVLGRFTERARRVAVAREPVWWAFASGMGASFLTHDLLMPLVVPLYGALYPSTVEHPSWLTPATIESSAAAFVAGAVLIRAGGLAAVMLFAGYQLLTLLLALPSRLAACAQLGGPIEDRLACDLPSMLVARWPWVAALVLGIVAARWLVGHGGHGTNRLLRAAGVYALVPAVFFAVAPLVFGRTSPSVVLPGGWTTYMLIVASVYVVAGVVGGRLLARVSLAAAVLLLLAVLATAVPQAVFAVRSDAPSYEPLELRLARWIGAAAPLASAAVLVAVRAWVRARTPLSRVL